MKLIVKDPGTGETVTLVAPVTLCGSRADFAELYDAIGSFFGWPGCKRFLSPSGYAEIEISEFPWKRPDTVSAPPATGADQNDYAVHAAIYMDSLRAGEAGVNAERFNSQALGAEDTPSTTPPGEPRLTPGSEPDDIPF